MSRIISVITTLSGRGSKLKPYPRIGWMLRHELYSAETFDVLRFMYKSLEFLYLI